MMATGISSWRRWAAWGAALRSRALAADGRIRRLFRHPTLWLTVAALLLAVQISPWWYASADGALYVAMARSHVSDDNSHPTLDSDAAQGYSLLISPAFLLGDRPFLALSVLHWLFAVALILGVYGWARRLAPRAAIWVALLTAANAGVCYYYRRTLKEILFMAAAVWTVNALHALAQSDTRGKLRRRLVLAAGLLSATILIRYSAVVLVPAFVLSLLLNRRQSLDSRGRWLVTAIVACSAAGLLGWVLTDHGANYLRAFQVALADATSTLAEGLRLRIASIARICTPGLFKAYAKPREWLDWNIALGVLLLIGVVAGWCRAAIRHRDPLILTFPLYIGLYMVWPFDQGARFMVPMVPVLIACFWFALDRLPRIRSLFMAACFATHAPAMLGYWLMIDAPRAAAWHEEWEPIEQLAEQIDLQRGPVACWQLPNEVRHMLAVCLNRPQATLNAGPEATRAAWRVQPGGKAVPRTWRFVVRMDEYWLMFSDPQVPPGSADSVPRPPGADPPAGHPIHRTAEAGTARIDASERPH
jgi:hypothetical protein